MKKVKKFLKENLQSLITSSQATKLMKDLNLKECLFVFHKDKWIIESKTIY